MDGSELEEKAKELFLWKLNSGKEKDFPEFETTREFSQCVEYLEKNNYWAKIGETPKSFMIFGYSSTPKGKEWAGYSSS
jgi:hypothetical protein